MKASELCRVLGLCDPDDEVAVKSYFGFVKPVGSACGDVRRPHVVILLPVEECEGGLTDGE